MRLKRTGILTKIVIAVLMVYAVVSLIRINGIITGRRSDLEDLQHKKADLAAEIDDMQHAIDNKDDPDVIRDIARERGYIDPDEEVYAPGK